MKKKHTLRTLSIIIAAFLILVLVGPFLIPPAPGTLPPEQLADSASRFIEVNGLSVHVKTLGQGGTAFILLHGFGANVFTWHAVMEPLSRYGMVIAYDRPGFGLTGRPMSWKGTNPYSPEANLALLLGLMDYFHLKQAILVGNSAGGALAMQFALAYPERVEALILVDPATDSQEYPGWMRTIGSLPQAQRLGALLLRTMVNGGLNVIRQAWHDPTKITQETWDGYEILLKVRNWDRGLWDFSMASQRLGTDQHLQELQLPMLVITGDDDRIIPTASTIQLAGRLNGAVLAVIPNAGHVPHEEQPAAFMDVVDTFLSNLQLNKAGATGLRQ